MRTLNARRYTVLVVEDSPPIADRIAELLGETSEVEALGTVETEPAAIEAIDRLHPDAIILDLSLKEGTGFGVIRHINSLVDNKPLIIVNSNYSLPRYRKMVEAYGVRHFLDKITEFQLIPQTLNTLLLELREAEAKAL